MLRKSVTGVPKWHQIQRRYELFANFGVTIRGDVEHLKRQSAARISVVRVVGHRTPPPPNAQAQRTGPPGRRHDRSEAVAAVRVRCGARLGVEYSRLHGKRLLKRPAQRPDLVRVDPRPLVSQMGPLAQPDLGRHLSGPRSRTNLSRAKRAPGRSPVHMEPGLLEEEEPGVELRLSGMNPRRTRSNSLASKERSTSSGFPFAGHVGDRVRIRASRPLASAMADLTSRWTPPNDQAQRPRTAE